VSEPTIDELGDASDMAECEATAKESEMAPDDSGTMSDAVHAAITGFPVVRDVSDPPPLTPEIIAQLDEEGRRASADYMARTRSMVGPANELEDRLRTMTVDRTGQTSVIADLRIRLERAESACLAAEATLTAERALTAKLEEDLHSHVLAARSRVLTASDLTASGLVDALASDLSVPATGEATDALTRCRFAVAEMQRAAAKAERSAERWKRTAKRLVRVPEPTSKSKRKGARR
jgi:hypothetical protein